MFDKFDAIIRDLNYRPLLMSMKQVLDILKDPSFHAIRFYATRTKTTGIQMPVLTLRYVLLNSLNKPYNLDGKPITRLDLSKFEASLLGLHATNKGFEVPKFAAGTPDNFGLNSIFNPTNQPIASITADPTKFVAFILTDRDSDTPVNFKLTYGIVAWGDGGIGGPGTGIRPIP